MSPETPPRAKALSVVLAAVVLAAAVNVAAPAATRPNILFIAVDDLRPAIGAYGDPHAVTPHLDALARSGTLFEKAYCQQAICSPSRTSLLTGLRPDTTRVYDLQTHFRDTIPGVVTLPELCRKNGYRVVGRGKIYHGRLDDQASWDSAPREGRPQRGTTWALPENQPKGNIRGPSWEKADVPDEAYQDGILAAEAVELLGSLKAGPQPFFLAVGFAKPHLPFNAPSRYWDLHDREALWPPPVREPPDGAPALAAQPSWELRNGYPDAPKDHAVPLDLEYEKILRQGFYAATSFVDAQIGRILDALGREGLADDTIVVLWGDHGFHVGDHGFWCKHTNFEVAVHSPLLLRVPGRGAGFRVPATVEFVDIYPTLAELCGLEPPAGLEGASLVRYLEQPGAPAIKPAYSQYPRGKDDSIMGYSVRTGRWRYTEWLEVGTGEVVGRELYDLVADPLSRRSVAADPEHTREVTELSRLLTGAGRGVGEIRARRLRSGG